MAPDDPQALDRFFAHQARVDLLIRRFLPPGFTSGHDLCYPRTAEDFVPTAAALAEFLAAYTRLLQLIDPKPNNMTHWGFLACMEMMDLNEMLIGYLGRAPGFDTPAALGPLLDADIRNLQTANGGNSHDDDSGKRFYRLRDFLRAMPS